MGYFLLSVIALLLISQSFIGLPGSVLAAVIVPGNMVEGSLSTTSQFPQTTGTLL